MWLRDRDYFGSQEAGEGYKLIVDEFIKELKRRKWIGDGKKRSRREKRHNRRR